jgi:hypothetical protein
MTRCSSGLRAAADAFDDDDRPTSIGWKRSYERFAAGPLAGSSCSAHERRSAADGRRRERSRHRRRARRLPAAGPSSSAPAAIDRARPLRRQARGRSRRRRGPRQDSGFFKAQMTAEVFVRHYTAVADASPVPVLLYNFTAVTGVNLPVAAVARLATHPNIAGMKESGGDVAQLFADLVSSTPGRSRCWPDRRRRCMRRCASAWPAPFSRWPRSFRRPASAFSR